MAFGRAGRIDSINEHHDGKHASISVIHGKKKKDKDTGGMTGYHRPSSTVHVPKAQAGQFKLGQRVNVSLTAGGDSPTPPKKKAKGKGKPPAKKAAAAAPSRIAGAMKKKSKGASFGGGYGC